MTTWSARTCHGGMANRRTWRAIASRTRTGDATAYEANLLDDLNLRILGELPGGRQDRLRGLGRRIRAFSTGCRRARATARARRHDARLPRRARSCCPRLPSLRGRAHPAVSRPAPARPGKSRRDARGVGECYRITGEDCYLLRLHLRSINKLEDVFDRSRRTGSRRHRSSTRRRCPGAARRLPATDL